MRYLSSNSHSDMKATELFSTGPVKRTTPVKISPSENTNVSTTSSLMFSPTTSESSTTSLFFLSVSIKTKKNTRSEPNWDLSFLWMTLLKPPQSNTNPLLLKPKLPEPKNRNQNTSLLGDDWFAHSYILQQYSIMTFILSAYQKEVKYYVQKSGKKWCNFWYQHSCAKD